MTDDRAAARGTDAPLTDATPLDGPPPSLATAPPATAQAASPSGPASPPTAAAGSIYDLGYQGYEGPRLGRRAAIGALFIHSLRSAFGIGRSGRSKIVPIGLTILALLPALVSIGVAALASQAGFGSTAERANPIRYGTYYGYIQTLVMLFVAAQAPELLGRDQRYHVLSLYFSRALQRIDYAVAKAAALVAAILVMTVLPQAAIFVGKVIADEDVVGALLDNAASVPPIVGTGLSIALLLGSIGLAVSAFTPRRAYATATIIGLFTVPTAVAALVIQATRGELARYLVLVSPSHLLDGLNAFLFGARPTDRTLLRADVPGELFLVAVVVVTVALLAVLVRRYQRIEP